MFQVGLVPSNLEASLAFYRDEVGLEPMMVVPLAGGRKLHLFSTGDGAVVKLLERGPDEPAPTPGGGGAFGDQIGIRWLTFDVGDLGAIAARMLGRVWQIEPTELRPGITIAIVNDPDGNAVEFVQRS